MIIGVVAWGESVPKESPGYVGDALLHGVYVHPKAHRQGVGTNMFAHAAASAERAGFTGFLVKASRDAVGFFARLGLERLQSSDAQYPYLFRKEFRPSAIAERSRIIEMAWEDRTPFEAIEAQFGLPESDVIRLMRRELKPSSYRLWRKRVAGRITKHDALRRRGVTRACSSGQ
jgi:uncharacterized protein (TIGR03643 family)